MINAVSLISLRQTKVFDYFFEIMNDKKKILIVEDDAALSALLAGVLRKEGITVIIAEDGVVGLKSAIDELPDLLVIDIELPIFSGITMLRSLREKGIIIPAIILTNSAQSEDVADATELLIKEYILKGDWGIEEVSAKILSWLEKT